MAVFGLVIALTLVAYLVALLYSFVMFDRLLRLEYDEHRAAWEQDGCPRGFFFHPPGIAFWQSRLAFYRVAFLWPLRRPAWVGESTDAAVSLRQLRTSLIAGCAALAVMMVSLILMPKPY
jgi:hypothetical protein